MTKTLLIYPSQIYAPFWGDRNPIKAHILNLFSFLRFNKIEVEILDLENEIGRPRTEDEIKKFRWKSYNLISEIDFDVVGISCWSSLNYLSTLIVAEICRNINNNCIIAVGGYHPTARPFDFLYKESNFDFIIRGEGEIALKEICEKKTRKGDKPQIIAGTLLNMKNDFPINWSECSYTQSAKEIPIYLSRGCPFSCSFCMEISKGNSRWRSYPVDIALIKIRSVIDTLEPIQISISDACFGFDKSWRKKFLNNLKCDNIEKNLWLETRLDILDRNDIDLFSDLGFRVQFGIESGSEKMLKIMRKTGNPKGYLNKCRTLVNYLNAKEVPYQLLLIFNHPGETYETYTKTIQFLRSLIRNQKKISGTFGGQTFSFFPGSYVSLHLKEYHQKYGVVVKYHEWWKQKGDHYQLSTSIIPSDGLMNRFSNLNYFQQDIDDLNHQIIEKMPDRLRSSW